MPSYAKLDAGKILETAERLARRIDERFPGAGLSKVAATLVGLAGTTGAEAALLAQPNIAIRAAVTALLLAGGAALALVGSLVSHGSMEAGAISLLQGIESAMNIAVLVGLGVLGLMSLESRWKRRRTLAALHMLRSLAHVIDMHQLTKDPSAAQGPEERTASSPARGLSSGLLERYLDYCSEMLALIGKLAALYAQSQQDRLVGQTVNEIEVLTTNLARKIWQKIAIIAERPVAA